MSERVRVTSPRTTSGRRLPPPSAAHEIDAQSQVGEVYLRSLLRAQLRLAIVVVALLAVLVGGLPLAFWLLPEVMDQEVLGMPLAWGLLAASSTRSSSRSAGGTSGPPSATSGPSPTSSSACDRPMSHTVRRRRGARGLGADGRHRHLGAALQPDDVRLLRGLSDGATRPQRLGHRRRVPLRRLLPRRRRAGAGVRGRHALVPRRLDGRVPPPARPGRRSAAAVGRVHAPGLRPGTAALAAGPHHHLGRWSWRSAGCT